MYVLNAGSSDIPKTFFPFKLKNNLIGPLY